MEELINKYLKQYKELRTQRNSVGLFVSTNKLILINDSNPLDASNILLDGNDNEGQIFDLDIEEAYRLIDICYQARENKTYTKLLFVGNSSLILFQ